MISSLIKAFSTVAEFFQSVMGWLQRKEQRDAGRNEEKVESLEDLVKDIQRANDVRDRLRDDVGYAERVRKRFTRDEK